MKRLQINEETSAGFAKLSRIEMDSIFHFETGADSLPLTMVNKALEPDVDPAGVVAFLRGQGDRARVAVVGHEPGLSELLALLLSGRTDGIGIELKKGGVALVRCERGVRAGGGELLWLLPPRVVSAVED